MEETDRAALEALAASVAAFGLELRAAQTVLRAVLPRVGDVAELQAAVMAEASRTAEQMQQLGCDPEMLQDYQNAVAALLPPPDGPEPAPAAGRCDTVR